MEEESCALVVAAFHTGREIVRQFFEVATGQYTFRTLDAEDDGGKCIHAITEAGGEGDDENGELDKVKGRLRTAEVFEIDVDGLRRPWKPVRVGESIEAAKRWCVVAVLVRR